MWAKPHAFPSSDLWDALQRGPGSRSRGQSPGTAKSFQHGIGRALRVPCQLPTPLRHSGVMANRVQCIPTQGTAITRRCCLTFLMSLSNPETFVMTGGGTSGYLRPRQNKTAPPSEHHPVTDPLAALGLAGRRHGGAGSGSGGNSGSWVAVELQVPHTERGYHSGASIE